MIPGRESRTATDQGGTVPESLTQTAFSALRWNYLGFLARSVATFGIGIILARLLGPKPFGELAAAALVFGLATQFADSGFSSALVQAGELTEADIRFAFTVQVLAGAVLASATMLAAPYFALAFHDSAIQTVLRGIAPLFLLQSFGQTSTGLLKRRLAHKTVQAAQVISYLTGYLLVGLPAAVLGAGVWSLVAAQLVQSFAYSIQVYLRVRHPLAPSLSRSGMRLFRFGSQTVANNIVNWSITNLDNAIIGHGFGSTSLGLYSRAFNLASTPVDGIVSTCQQVLFASCSRAAQRIAAIRRAYLASVAALAAVLFPACWSLAVCSRTVVVALYGDRWAAVAPLFTPLAVALPIHAMMAVAGPLLGATDRVKLEIRAQSLTLLFCALAFGIAAHYSATAVAWAVLCAYTFRFLAVTAPALPVLGLAWSDVLRAIRGPLSVAFVLAGLMFAADRIGSSYLIQPGAAFAALAVTGLTAYGSVIGLAGHLVFAPDLVGLLQEVTSLPPFAGRWLTRIACRQTRTALPSALALARAEGRS